MHTFFPFVLEWGGVQCGIRQWLVQPVPTIQILHQDDDHESPEAGENHRRQVRNFVPAPLCFGECKEKKNGKKIILHYL